MMALLQTRAPCGPDIRSLGRAPLSHPMASSGNTATKRRALRLQCNASAEAPVRFTIKRGLNYGEFHKIVGGHPSLGDWNVDAAPQMGWTEGDTWSTEVQIPAGQQIEFKCIKVAGDHIEWEHGGNRTVQIAEGPCQVAFDWGNEGSLRVESLNGKSPSSNGAVEAVSEQEPATEQENGSSPPPGNGVKRDTERLPHQQWQGRSTQFMRSNEHSRERAGVWNTQGLEGAALALVEGDEKSGSWLKKLQLVKDVLVDTTAGAPDLNTLANAYIYLQFISTGAIECVEGGGHYRPNKHAELAREIFRALERLLEKRGTSQEARLLARKTHTKLPSFTAEFTASTPLTRIRDIAHRSDIPHDLKQEIKHTIQNKLHRNAGPEDLVATEEMLERITAPGADFSGDFVEQFRLFTAELRDFFNAGSLADLLNALRPSLDDSGYQVLDRFLEAKEKVDSGTAANQEDLENHCIDAFHDLTSVRALLASGLQSGMRNDASDDSMAMRQRWRLSEIRAEDYAFVLISRFINLLEERGGSAALSEAAASEKAWSLPLGAAILGIRQLGLNGWDQQECLALENELGAWQQEGNLSNPTNALRLKASLERLQRLTQSYADAMIRIFPERASQLGKALGLDQDRVTVFTEAEIRASVVFQLSKLVTLLLKAARLNTGAGAWDAIVAGEAYGRLVAVDRIEAGALPEGSSDPVILLVKEASGDEEVGAAGANLKGVILSHSLPHLSHLGVRARQEKVPFATCEDEDTLQEEVRSLLGKGVNLSVSAAAVTVKEQCTEQSSASSNGAAPAAARSPKAKAGAIKKVAVTLQLKIMKTVALEKATPANCGAKAAACAELAKVAAGANFSTPAGVCLPFGTMDAAIKAAGMEQEFQDLLSQTESAKLEGGALDAACAALQDLVSSVAVKDKVLEQACSSFPADATLIARSSANVEDLAGMSGAGLYESIAGIPASQPRALGKAVAGVWASLYTRRAVLSRRAAGVPQADAAMAVLIQEQLKPQYSFILHTQSPVSADEDALYAELAAGLGETLASGTRGSPWRLSVEHSSGNVKVLAFSNFSHALVAETSKTGSVAVAGYKSTVVDHSKQELSRSEERRREVGSSLAAVGVALEKAFKGPQDVEGALVGSDVYIVQTRPQP